MLYNGSNNTPTTMPTHKPPTPATTHTNRVLVIGSSYVNHLYERRNPHDIDMTPIITEVPYSWHYVTSLPLLCLLFYYFNNAVCLYISVV